jgi:hypothetical protein
MVGYTETIAVVFMRGNEPAHCETGLRAIVYSVRIGPPANPFKKSSIPTTVAALRSSRYASNPQCRPFTGNGCSGGKSRHGIAVGDIKSASVQSRP